MENGQKPGAPDQQDFETEEDFFKACRKRRVVEPSESQEETHNCAECNAPLIKKKNATVLDPSTLLCHSCWTETWAILFQMIREGKYDQCKEKFKITRK